MATFDYDYSNKDYELIGSEQLIENFEIGDYVRLTIYTITRAGGVSSEIYKYNDGISNRVKAVFYSSVVDVDYEFQINNSPFFNNSLELQTKQLGNESQEDFKVYRNPNGTVYVKPNEIFNEKNFPEGNYRVKVDILKQVLPSSITPEILETLGTGGIGGNVPRYFTEYDYNDDGVIDDNDVNAWMNVGRPDIANLVSEMIANNETPPLPGEGQQIVQSSYYNNPNYVGYHYQFSLKQISTSRREVRLKILNQAITRDSYVLSDLQNQFNGYSGDYKFGHFLNVGDGNHIPITNYHFDAVTDGKDNQSIILRLYKPLPRTISKLKQISIETEKVLTQYTDIFYFSDVAPGRDGDGLIPDPSEDWINTSENDSFNYENYNTLTSSLSEVNFNQLLSSSIHEYPNINIDYNDFSNHTFFGSAKRKLVNFKTKVETIQGYYSEISKSLTSPTTAVSGDPENIKTQRKNLFNKINDEIRSFTPYEKFLYFDGQSESTASAPSVGKNYANSIPVSTVDYVGQLDGGDGFDVVYHHSNINRGTDQYIGLYTNQYYAHNKPFFNYSSSIYLSFLMKRDDTGSLTFQNAQKDYVNLGGDVQFPQDSKFKENILNPHRTSSGYQRYIFHTSHSYWMPTGILSNDLSNIRNFSANSSEVTILSGSIKTGSYQIRDSSGKYQNYSTVVTQSGAPFKGSVMPGGELFRIFYENTLSQSLQSLYRFDEGSGTTALDTSGNGNSGTIKNGAAYTTDSANNTALSFDGTNDYVELAQDSFGDLSTTDFSIATWISPGDDIAEFDVVLGRRDDSNGPGFVLDLRDASGEGGTGDGAHPFAIAMVLKGSGQVVATGATTIPKNEYSHVAAVVDRDATVKVYVNGVEDGSVSCNLTNQGADITGSNNKIGIGARVANNGTTTSNLFPGKIDEVRFYRKALTATEVQQLYLLPDGISDSKITDVKITLKNPTDAQPFSELYHTSSTAWTTWYDGTYDSASIFDRDNIHSLENNLPTYIQESSEYNDLKDFLSLQGEQYDIIRNHIDSIGKINDRGYQELNSPPKNIYPILLDNLGYEAINPFSGNLTETLGSYLSGVTSIDDIKNNTWRKTLNNLIYVYKSKGTKNSVRGLLNIYGYPPDVIPMREFGSTTKDILDFVTDDEPDSTPNNVDTDLDNQQDNIRYFETTNKLFNYRFGSEVVSDRVLNLDWYMDNANINTLEFVYKHVNTTQTQTILESSGSGTQTLWDIRVIPSSDGVSSSFEFRLNNSNTGSLPIATNAVSMSTNYVRVSNGQLWNVMLQRMTSSISGSGTNTYKLHTALQNESKIPSYELTKMSISGALTNTYVTGGDVMTGSTGGRGYFANQNWLSSGSRHFQSSSNLVLGRIFSGSLAEIKSWTTALSNSKFRQHTFNKFSTVGNTINSHREELVYHFKLNENYTSASISSSTQTPYIIDSAPKTTLSTDYSFTIPLKNITGSLTYGFDNISTFEVGLQDNSLDNKNDNKIRINPKRSIIGNLHPTLKSIKIEEKPISRNSVKLELDISPTNKVDNFILDKLGGFNFEKLYGNPINYYSESYGEFDTFRKNFLDAHPIEIDVNKFIRAHENMFNNSIIGALQTLVPGRVTFCGDNSNFGVEIRQTILEKQKYENHQYSVEVNPGLASGSIVFIENTEYKQQSLVSNLELPYSASLGLGNSYSASRDYIHSPFLQPAGVTGSIEFPKSGSAIFVSESIFVNTTTITYPHSGSLSMGNSYQTESADGTYTISDFLQSSGYSASLELQHSTSINHVSTHHNKSFVNIHDSWGTSSADTQFINFAAGTGSDGNYNVGHIDTRYIFNVVGDIEYYSSSFGKASSFGEASRFFNRTQDTENLKSGVEYDSKGFGVGNGVFSGRMIGKTRYFQTSSTDGTIESLPLNHVSKFANNFKDTMYAGTQNTNPGFYPKTSLEDKDVDHSTSSFYSITVTGGENQIIIKSGDGTIGSDGSINY